MKKRLVCAVFAIAVWTVSAAAQQNFVDRFLNRYRPAQVTLPAFPGGDSRVGPAGLAPDGGFPLTSSDVIGMALQNNLDIAVNRLTPYSARTGIGSAYLPFEPTFRLEATVGRNTSPSLSQLSGAQSISQLSHSYLIGLSKALETGGAVGLDFVLNRTSSNNAFNTFNPSWVGQVRYSFTQHFLRDYGREINTRQIRIAQNNVTISQTQFERQAIDLVVQAQRSYWDLVFTVEDLKVKRRSLELANKTLSDNRIQVEIGTLARLDLIQAESEVAQRNDQLVTSTFTQTQVEDQIKKLIVSTFDPGVVLMRLSPMETAVRPLPGDVLPVEEAIKVAFENRPELRQLDLELTNRDLDVLGTKNQLLPQLDLSASYTQNGVGGTETLRNGFGANAPIISVNPGGLYDTFGQLFGYNYTGYSVGVTLQIPLGNRAKQSDYSRAVIERRTAEDRIGAFKQQIALEVRNAVNMVEQNRVHIETARIARDLAEQQLAAEQKRFDLGASTVRFVFEEQRNVTQTQTNEIAALVNYSKALVDYNRAIGMTLKKNNIEIDKTLGMKAGN